VEHSWHKLRLGQVSFQELHLHSPKNNIEQGVPLGAPCSISGEAQ